MKNDKMKTVSTDPINIGDNSRESGGSVKLQNELIFFINTHQVNENNQDLLAVETL